MQPTEFNTQYCRDVELPSAGITVTLRRPSLRRAIRTSGLQPAWIKAVIARKQGVEYSDDEIRKARAADVRAFEQCLLIDAAIVPRFSMERPPEDVELLWLQLLTDEEQDMLMDVCRELMGLDAAEVETVAPFRDDADAGAVGAALAHDTGRAD